jgi:hypothetical protein
MSTYIAVGLGAVAAWQVYRRESSWMLTGGTALAVLYLTREDEIHDETKNPEVHDFHNRLRR